MARLKCRSPIVCLPPTRLLRSSPLAGTSWAPLFFSIPQHQNSLLVHAHMHTKDTDNHQTCMGTHTHAHRRNISCESSLIELTPQLTARFTMFRSKMEDWGRNKCWASQWEEANAATLLLLLDHRESSTSFLHNLCPLWPQRNWGTLPFHIYPFLCKPPHGLFPGLPPLLLSFEELCHISSLAFI